MLRFITNFHAIGTRPAEAIMAEQHPLDQVLESHSTDQRAPILRLPIDMIAEILANFDSTKSLLPVILAHSIFLEAFTTQQHRILQEILRRQIPARLLSLATVVQKTAHTDVGPSADGKPGPVTQNWDKIYHIMRHHRKPELLRPFKLIAPLTPTIAVAMEKTHSMVNFFMLAFIDRAVSNGNAIFGVPTAGIFATRRTYRLSQAFYRFQLYCNVFGNDPITLANRSPLPIPRDRARQSLETFFLAWNDRANTQLALSLVYLRGEILISE